MNSAHAILVFVQIWGMIGAAVALVFLTIGIDRIDEDARGAYVFRPLLIPAVLLIWPLIVWRWWILETAKDNWALRHRPPRQAHLWVACALIVLIPATLTLAWTLRQDWPTDFEPQQLSPPSVAEE